MHLTGILVTCNEEHLVRACLDSMVPLVNQLIVCHDGPCSDRSIDIARSCTDKVFENPKFGCPEPNKIIAQRKARHEWILNLDCDETLSEQMHGRILALKERESPPDTNRYLGIWKSVYGPANVPEEASSGGLDVTQTDLCCSKSPIRCGWGFPTNRPHSAREKWKDCPVKYYISLPTTNSGGST